MPSLPPTYSKLTEPSDITLSRERFPELPPRFVMRLALGIRNFLLRLADAITPPEVAIFEHAVGAASTAILGAVVDANVADALDGGPRTAKELAESLGLDADALHRTLRLLASLGIFTLRPDGSFAQNRLSRALVRGNVSRMREWIVYFASKSNLAAWSDFAETLRTGKNAFARVHGKNVWQWFEEHADERETFAHAMMGITTFDAPAIASIYPFAEVRVLCDIGGGRGTLLSELLLRHSHLRGILYDAEGVIESARKVFRERGVAERVTCVAGSFFERVPAGADAYVMKNVLHDWDDATCERILRVARKAMNRDGRLLICEMIVDENRANLMGSRSDLQMMTVCEEGRERSVKELEALLRNTGFRLSRIFPSPLVGVLEAAPV